MVAYERLPQSEVRLYTEICKISSENFFIFYFQPAKFYQPCMITVSEPHFLFFYSADCEYTAVIRRCLEMPHFRIVTKIFTTQRLTHGKSVLRFSDIQGGIHSKLEN